MPFVPYSHVEGMELCSVGNSHTLKSSKLVDAFNLKVSVVYLIILILELDYSMCNLLKAF